MEIAKDIVSILLATTFFTTGASVLLLLPVVSATTSTGSNSSVSGNVNISIISTPDSCIDLDFIPWGNGNDLKLSKVNLTGTSSLYRLYGNTGNESVGFYSPNLYYKDKYLSMTLGNWTNTILPSSSSNFSVSFAFDIKGMREDYRVMLVHGPSMSQGWKNNTYYEQISTNSSRIINLVDLLKFYDDAYLSVEKVAIIVPEQPTLSFIDFKIKFSAAIENFPL